MGWCSSRTGQSGSEVWRGLASMEPAGPCWPLPSLSSWQMKEPKQSSPALSNAPGTPCPDPPTASLRGQKGGQLRLKDRGSRPCFSSSGPSGAVDPRRAACRWSGPAGGECGPGRGCPATVAKDIPLWEPPPPLPLPPAVPGPRQRKTKTRAEETAAGAPPEKPGQKARASCPRCPAAGGLAPLPGSLPLALAAQCASRPPDYLPPSRPLPRAAPAPAPFPTTSGCFCGRAPRCRAVCPRLCPRSGDAATPALLPPPRQRLDPPPFLDQRPHLGGPGLRARRDPDQAEGDSIHRAAGEALWPGHCWGRRQGPGRGGTEGAGSNAEGGVCLRSAPCAPDRAHPLPLAGLQMRTAGLRSGLSLTEPAEEGRSQGDSLGWPSPEKTIQAGKQRGCGHRTPD